MTAPYRVQESDNTLFSHRLQSILDVLSNFHKDILQEKTLQGQSPKLTLLPLQQTLADYGDALEDYIRWKEIPEKYSQDQKFRRAVQSLDPLLDPWSADISVLAPQWVSTMFKEFPFSIDPNHINRINKTLLQNSGYSVEENGFNQGENSQSNSS